ncbi:MAG: hypothetical protein KDA62_18480 [Planctomycetales bacterium]|nr:hypothetical protein [Planctomycetales bacterium]
MHERTQRSLCRLAFIGLCLIPTLFSLGWIAYGRTDHHQTLSAEVWREQLADWSGLHCEIGGIRYPRPGETVLEDVVLADSETRQTIAELRLLVIERQGNVWMATASQPTIHADHVASLIDLLHERMLKRLPSNFTPIEVNVAELTIADEPAARTLADVRAVIESGGNESRVSIDFRVAGVEMSDRALFRATRHRAARPSTTWEFHTGAAGLPTNAAAGHFPWLESFGDRCEFRGTVLAKQADNGWQGRMSGQFSQLDLDRLVSQRFPHKLSGRADVLISDARFEASRLTLFDATIVSEGGVVSQSLLQAAIGELQLRRAETFLDGQQRHVAYEQLAVRAVLQPTGLALQGICDHQPTRTLLAGRDGPILFDAEARELPTAALVRLLATSNDHQVPATRETAALFDILPLPPIERADGPTPAAYVPVRLRP